MNPAVLCCYWYPHFFMNFSCYASDMNIGDIHYNHLLVRVEKILVLIQKASVITCNIQVFHLK